MGQTLSSASNSLKGLNDLEKSIGGLTVVDNETQMETAESAPPNDQMQAEQSVLNVSQSTEDDLICIGDEDENSNTTSKKIRCMCQLTGEFCHIELVMCSGCSYLQHALCMGYLYTKDVADNYTCQVCKFGTSLKVRQIRHQRVTAICRLMIGYAYFFNEFPEEIFVKLTSEVQPAIKKKLKFFSFITENNGKFSVNVQHIGKKFLGVWFRPSFIKRHKTLPDIMNFYKSSSSDEDSLIAEEPSRKRIKSSVGKK